MSIIGPDGKPINSKDTNEKEPQEAQTPENADGHDKEGESGEPKTLTEEDIKNMAESHPYSIETIIPAAVFFVQEKDKETGELMPERLCVQHAVTGEIYVITQSTERIVAPSTMTAAIHMRSVEERRRQALMGGPSAEALRKIMGGG